MRQVDLKGKRIGTITVLDCVGVNKDGRSLWRCRCDCGNEYTTTSGTLRSAKTCKRCANLLDIQGRRFGKLAAVSHQYNEAGQHCWVCHCDCGNTVVYSQQSLIRGKATTCRRCQINAYSIVNGTVIGRTSTGVRFLFDVDCWNDVVGRTWYRTAKGYIVSGRRKDRVVLHRLVMKAPEGMQVDHINRDRTDCRRKNLRLATNALNCANTSAYSNNQSSGHKNVYMVDGRYRVAIRKGGRLLHFGYYDALEFAVSVANKKRRLIFGEFAYYDDMFDNGLFREADHAVERSSGDVQEVT